MMLKEFLFLFLHIVFFTHSHYLAVSIHYRSLLSGGGISQYTNDPSQAGKSLEPCLDVAHNAIPAGLRRETPIYLGATAGMRLLE